MQYTEIMVRYGELSTKGKNRQSFIDRLAHNTRQALRDFPQLEIKAHRDRMHIKLNGTDSKAVTARLDRIFGIQNYSPTVRVEKELAAAKKAAIELVKERFKPGMTFKVNTRRADHKFKYDTNQMNDLLGDAILEAVPGIKVRMKEPDILVRVEVRIDGIYLSLGKVKAAGGMPVGTAGKGMMMLSGGIDSPVAAYLAMKRGVEVEMVHFFSPPYTSEQALNKAAVKNAQLTADNTITQKLQDAKNKAEVDKRRIFSYAADEFRTLFNATENIDERSFRALISKASSELKRLSESDSVIRRLIGAAPRQSTDDAVAQLVMNNTRA